MQSLAAINYKQVNTTLFLFFASLIVLMLLVWFGGHYYVGLMLPLYEWVVGLGLPDGFRVVEITQTGGSREQFITLVTETTQPFLLKHQVIPVGVTADSKTLQGHAYQIPIVTLSLLMAWPHIVIKHRIVMILISLPFIAMLALVDIPIVLLGAFIDLTMHMKFPDSEPEHFLITWMTLMNDGGRVAVGIVATLGVVSFFKGIFNK